MPQPEMRSQTEARLRRSPLLIYVAAFTAILCLVTFSWPDADAQAKDRKSRSRTIHKKIAPKKDVIKKKPKKRVPATQSVQAKAVYCINVAKNETLVSRNPDQRLPVASLTKLVTALVALEHFSPAQKITVPDEIKNTPKSVVGLKPGDKITCMDLLHGLLIGSGNDCAETLAAAFPGGRKKFVQAMNKKSRELGTRKTIFYTPSGLDRKTTSHEDGKTAVEVDSNQSTAREIALIARAAFANETVRLICMKKSHVISSAMKDEGYPVRTTNKLLRDNLPLAGGKTGFTVRAGHCLATEFRPGRNVLLIVVLGSPDHFKDTRLVYRKALKEASKITIPPIHKPGRIAAK